MDSDAEFPLLTVGAWYQTIGGDLFEVVAVDENEDSIEVQYFDGTVAEFDSDAWSELVPAPASPPEDWSGSLDISREDYGVDVDEIPLNERLSARNYLDGT